MPPPEARRLIYRAERVPKRAHGSTPPRDATTAGADAATRSPGPSPAAKILAFGDDEEVGSYDEALLAAAGKELAEYAAARGAGSGSTHC